MKHVTAVAVIYMALGGSVLTFAPGRVARWVREGVVQAHWFCLLLAAAEAPLPKGVYSFGTDQTIADISKMEWAPLQLQGLPPGIEIATLRGDLAKGGGEFSCERLLNT